MNEGRYQAYPEYKDSGVEWLDKVPIGWTTLGLGKVLLFMNNGCSSAQIGQSEDSVGITRIETISDGIINAEKIGYVLRNDIPSRYLLKLGDIQFSNINSLKMIGNCAMFEGGLTLYAGMNLLHIRPDLEKVHPKYLLYQFKSKLFRNKVEASAKPAINQASIPTGTLRSFGFLCPPLGEQQQIANFLDHETTKIDTLIEKQQQLIALLKEKRQAVISHAVTKGLNPGAPMKDSGVEWLGEVPEHWVNSSLGFECRVKARLGWKGLKADEYVEEGYIFLATPNIKGDEIDFHNVNYITKERYEESPEIMLEVGDVLVTKDGSTTGTTNVVRSLPREATVNSSIAVLRSFGRVNALYLYYFFISEYTQNVIKRMQDGMGVPHLFQADLRKFHLLVPPLEEQKEIGVFLDEAVQKLDFLIEKGANAIELLQERRTALISAAVTGKIDVRNWQPPTDKDIQ